MNAVLCLGIYCNVCNICLLHVSYINCIRGCPTASLLVCVRLCICVYVFLCVCVCTWVWKFQFDFLLNTWFVIPILNMWVSEIRVCISTFLLAEESIFGTNKLHFFQGLQWSWVKVAINRKISSKCRLSSLLLQGEDELWYWKWF